MNFRRTPTIEASLIYGVALILSVLLFAAISGWGSAMQLSQWVAALLMMPTWLLMVGFGFLTRKRQSTKFGRFFMNISVVAVVSVIAVVLLLPAAHNAVYRSSLAALVAVYFISNLIAAVLTQFVFFRKWVEPRPGSEFGAVPTLKSRSKKAKK